MFRIEPCPGSNRVCGGPVFEIWPCPGNEGALEAVPWLSLTGHGGRLAVVQVAKDEEDGSP
jgi:hypothetical protein